MIVLIVEAEKGRVSDGAGREFCLKLVVDGDRIIDLFGQNAAATDHTAVSRHQPTGIQIPKVAIGPEEPGVLTDREGVIKPMFEFVTDAVLGPLFLVECRITDIQVGRNVSRRVM